MVMGYIICAIYHNNMSALEYLNYYLKRHICCSLCIKETSGRQLVAQLTSKLFENKIFIRTSNRIK